MNADDDVKNEIESSSETNFQFNTTESHEEKNMELYHRFRNRVNIKTSQKTDSMVMAFVIQVIVVLDRMVEIVEFRVTTPPGKTHRDVKREKKEVHYEIKP